MSLLRVRGDDGIGILHPRVVVRRPLCCFDPRAPHHPSSRTTAAVNPQPGIARRLVLPKQTELIDERRPRNQVFPYIRGRHCLLHPTLPRVRSLRCHVRWMHLKWANTHRCPATRCRSPSTLNRTEGNSRQIAERDEARCQSTSRQRPGNPWRRGSFVRQTVSKEPIVSRASTVGGEDQSTQWDRRTGSFHTLGRRQIRPTHSSSLRRT